MDKLDSQSSASAAGAPNPADAVAPKSEPTLASPGTTDAATVDGKPPVNPAPVEPPKPATNVPDKYTLVNADGTTVDAAKFDEKKATFFKELGLSNEQAQKLYSSEVAREADEKKQNEETIAQWRKSAESDPEVGGERLKESVELARRFSSKFGGSEFAEFLDTSGLGNHPAVLRAFARAGRAMMDDKIVTGKDGGKGLSIEDRWYPGQNK